MKRFSFCSCCITPLLLFAGFCVLAILMMYRGDKAVYDSSCQSHLKSIALGFFMYAQDYDEKLSPAIFPEETVGWANGLQPYLRNYDLFQCPLEDYNQRKYYSLPSILQWLSFSSYDGKVLDPHQPRFTSYWLNSNIAGLAEEELMDPTRIIMLGDGDGNSPQSMASYVINQLPAAWLQAGNSPAKRHLGGANYAFADGHVKWAKPEEITQAHPSKKNRSYTFRIK